MDLLDELGVRELSLLADRAFHRLAGEQFSRSGGKGVFAPCAVKFHLDIRTGILADRQDRRIYRPHLFNKGFVRSALTPIDFCFFVSFHIVFILVNVFSLPGRPAAPFIQK